MVGEDFLVFLCAYHAVNSIATLDLFKQFLGTTPLCICVTGYALWRWYIVALLS